MPHRSLEAGRVATAKHYAANKEYYAERNRQRREEFRAIIQNAKNVPCVDCGASYPYYVMDFDHLGDKIFTIAQIYKISSVKKLLEEIAKCDVVCSNCHRIRTHCRVV
jgi:hypothetical protein